MRIRLLSAVGLALLLVGSLGPPCADGCGLLADAPHICCSPAAAPTAAVTAGCCADGAPLPSSTPCRPSPSSVASDCACLHAPATPPAAATGVAAPTAPELEAQPVVTNRGTDSVGTLGMRLAGAHPASSTHDPPPFLLGCTYLI